jgi:hypothetical protein
MASESKTRAGGIPTERTATNRGIAPGRKTLAAAVIRFGSFEWQGALLLSRQPCV